MIIKNVMSAGPSSFSSSFSTAIMTHIPGPIVESDFEWDSGDTTWGETALYDTLWDNVRYKYLVPTGHYSLAGGNSKGTKQSANTQYWLEAGGACGMWLEDDNRTYTEWWDEVTSETPWDQGKTPWDTKRDPDTVWDEAGTGVFEKTYWYDFVAIGDFITQGGNAGRGYSLHAQAGQFNADLQNTLDNVGKRTKTGVFTLKGIRAYMTVTSFAPLEAGSFRFKGKPSEVYWYKRGPIDHILDARPVEGIIEAEGEWDNGSTIWEEVENGSTITTEWWDTIVDSSHYTFELNGGESKGKYVQGGCVRNPTEWDKHNPSYTDWDTHNVRDTWWDTHKLRCLHPEPATFILTGMDAGYDNYTHLDGRAAAQFIVDGQDVSGIRITYVDTGEFILEGQSVGYVRGYNSKVESGSYTLTGQEATLINNTYTRLSADTGQFILSGQSSGEGTGISTDAGHFTVSGTDVGYQIDLLAKVEAGEFILSGVNAETTNNYTLRAEREVLSITGWDIHYTLGSRPTSATFILTGQDALREDHRSLTANTGVFTLDGVSSGIHYFKDLSGTSFTLTGYDTNRQQRHISRVGEFNLEGQDASRDRHPTLKVTEAGEFTLTGYNSSVGLLKPSLEAATFVVDGVDAGTNVNITRTVKPTHYTLSGTEAYPIYTPKEYFASGCFDFAGHYAELRVNRNINWSVASSAKFVVNGLPTEQDRNQTLSAEAGEFIVKYDCNAKSFKASTGEFILSGQRAVFNSKHYTFNAGPNAHFRVELQSIHRYGDHDYGKTLEYTLTGSDVFFRCGAFDYTKWDSTKTNWDTFRSLWDKRYLGDKPCAIRPDTVQPATFILTGQEVDGYTNNSDYPDAIAFDAGELLVNGAGSNQNWIAETGHFRAEMTSVSYYDYSIDNAGRFEVGSGGEIGGMVWRVGCDEVIWDDVTYTDWDDANTLWKYGFTEWDERHGTIWKELEGNTIVETKWYSGEATFENLVPCIRYTRWDNGETMWQKGYTKWDRSVDHNCTVIPSGSSETGVFLLDGMDTDGDIYRKPNNVILLANHRGDFHVLNCDKDKETFWDKRMGTEWFDKVYGTALWDSETAESAVKWDPDDATRTQWDKDKSRWDKNKCTELNLDYRLVANCK